MENLIEKVCVKLGIPILVLTIIAVIISVIAERVK